MNKVNSIDSISIIGFDVRISPIKIEKKIDSFDCLYPLSTDKNIWPSIFISENSSPTLLPEIEEYVVPVPICNTFFNAFDLWDSSVEMYQSIRDLTIPSCGIALGLTVPNRYNMEIKTDSWFDAIHEGTGISPTTPSEDWPFLGFDVVNSGLSSALSSFSPHSNVEIMQNLDSNSINQLCLLSDQGISTKLCHTANTLYQSDGPFFSIALFLLWDDTGKLSSNTHHLKKVNYEANS